MAKEYVDPRYIDKAKLYALLARLFAGQPWQAEVRRGKWVIETPTALSKVGGYHTPLSFTNHTTHPRCCRKNWIPSLRNKTDAERRVYTACSTSLCSIAFFFLSAFIHSLAGAPVAYSSQR